MYSVCLYSRPSFVLKLNIGSLTLIDWLFLSYMKIIGCFTRTLIFLAAVSLPIPVIELKDSKNLQKPPNLPVGTKRHTVRLNIIIQVLNVN